MRIKDFSATQSEIVLKERTALALNLQKEHQMLLQFDLKASLGICSLNAAELRRILCL